MNWEWRLVKWFQAWENEGDKVAIGLILVLHMIGWEDGASSLDKSKSDALDKEIWE